MADLIIIGNNCVDIYLPPHEMPPLGGMVMIDAPKVEIGGNGANTAVAARRLGTPTALAGVLGDDLFGVHLRSLLAAEDLDLTLLETAPGRASPSTFIHNDDSGERSFVHHPGTNADFSLSRQCLETPCEIFHMAAPELLGTFWPEDCLEAARQLKAADRKLSLDIIVVGDDATDVRRQVADHRPILELADMTFPNEHEAELITGKTDLHDMVAYLHDMGIDLVAIKRGERGAVVSWDGHFEEVGVPSTQAVDTCGAGDNFVGGFLAGTLQGLDPAQAARLGCALGTLCVTAHGALTASADPGRLEEIVATFDLNG